MGARGPTIRTTAIRTHQRPKNPHILTRHTRCRSCGGAKLKEANREDRCDAGSNDDFLKKVLLSNGRSNIEQCMAQLHSSAMTKSTRALEKVLRQATSNKAIRSGAATKVQVLDYAEVLMEKTQIVWSAA